MSRVTSVYLQPYKSCHKYQDSLQGKSEQIPPSHVAATKDGAYQTRYAFCHQFTAYHSPPPSASAASTNSPHSSNETAGGVMWPTALYRAGAECQEATSFRHRPRCSSCTAKWYSGRQCSRAWSPSRPSTCFIGVRCRWIA